MIEHPIDRAEACVDTAPVLAADLALQAFGATRHRRSDTETDHYLGLLARATLASGACGAGNAINPVDALFEENACEKLACAALLRLLVLDDDPFDEALLRGRAITLFDRLLQARLYPQLHLSTKAQ